MRIKKSLSDPSVNLNLKPGLAIEIYIYFMDFRCMVKKTSPETTCLQKKMYGWLVFFSQTKTVYILHRKKVKFFNVIPIFNFVFYNRVNLAQKQK